MSSKVSSKTKLLLISAIPPFTQTSGGATRIYHTIKELSRKYSIYFISFNSPDNDFYKQYTAQFTNLDLRPKSLSSSIPYRFSDWDNQELSLIIPKIINEYQIKTVQVEFSQLLYLADFIPKDVKKIFTAHDISTVSFYRRIPESSGLFKKIVSVFFWWQIRNYEKNYLSKFDQINTVSTTDQKILQKNFHLSSTVVPNGIESINFLSKKSSTSLNLGFIGSFSHPPNKFAVEYFLNKISPILDKSNIKYHFFLAGSNSGFSHPKVTNLGVVDNIRDFYQKIDVLVAPIFSGSGTRIKILESLSFGVPVITTAIGAEGIDINSPFLQIAGSPTEFVDLISQYSLPADKEKNNLKSQLQTYLWSNIFQQYFSEINHDR